MDADQPMTAAAAPPAERGQRLLDLAARVLEEARRQGASDAEAVLSESRGFDVTVRLGEVETVEYTDDNSLDVKVFFGKRTGTASTADFSDAALRDTVRAACAIAKYTAEDPHFGLAEAELLAREFPDLDLYAPWPVTVPEALERALACETAARDADPRICNSEGAGVGTHHGCTVYANTNGFAAARCSSSHGTHCSVVAQEKNSDAMQRDHWFTSARHAAELEPPQAVGRMAARRAVARLGGRRVKTARAPVLFEAPAAKSLLGHFAGAVRGASLYRKASFLLDALDKKVFSDFIRIHEQPHLPRAMGSAAWDGEGVATRARDLVSGGVLRGYILDSYAARKLGMQTTANAGGTHNLTVDGGGKDLDALIKEMHRGLLVTELIGFGVNTVTGDYSRGAAGFWVEHGEIQHPAEEITIAGNLKEMFTSIAAIGNDTDTRGGTRSGSVLVGEMTVAGD